MKICFVDRIGAHAIWGVIAPVAERLVAEGHEVTFVRMDDGGDRGRSYIPDKVQVVDLKVPSKRGILSLIRQNLAFARQFLGVLRRLEPDVVHTNFAVPSIVARWAAARERVPTLVSTQHELYGSMRPHYRWGLRLTERYCSAVVYVSRAVARSFGRAVDTPGDASRGNSPIHVVIPNGVDIGKIRAAIAGVERKVPGRIVCAGRMVPLKGQHLLIEALPDAVRRHPQLRLHLVGSGPMEDRLRQRVDELGLAEHVVFLGWRPHDELLHEMAAAELVVVPSDNEGFGLVVAEALVCGAPLLVSDIPVFHEVLDKAGPAGRFFPRDDVSALTGSLVEFPFATPGDQVAANAPLKPIEDLEHLSSHAMVNAYVSLYRELVTGDNG